MKLSQLPSGIFGQMKGLKVHLTELFNTKKNDANLKFGLISKYTPVQFVWPH